MQPRYLQSLHPDLLPQLRHWGTNLRLARRRRKLTQTAVSKALLMDRRTLAAAESGSPSVSVGAYAALMHYYGFTSELEQLAAPWRDPFADRILPEPDNKF